MALFGLSIDNVWKYNRNKNHKGLIKALRYKKSPKIRIEAAKSLAELCINHTVGPLIEALNDEEPKVRINASKALGKIKDPRAINPLIELLTDSNKDVQKYALNALSWIGSPAVNSLIIALSSKNPLPRKNAIKAIAFMKQWDKSTILPLLEAACDSDKDVSDSAHYALNEIGDRFIIKSLLDFGETGINVLIKFIQFGKDAKLKLSLTHKAYKILKNEDLIAQLDLLLKQAKSDDFFFRDILRVFENINRQPQLRTLISILIDEHTVDKVLAEAAMVLGKIGNKEAVQPLVNLFKKKFSHSYPSADIAESLERLNWEPETDEMKVFYWIIKGEANKCIESGESAREPIIKFLNIANNDNFLVSDLISFKELKSKYPNETLQKKYLAKFGLKYDYDFDHSNREKIIWEVLAFEKFMEFIYVLGKIEDEKAFEIIHLTLSKGKKFELLIAARALVKIDNSKEIFNGIEIILNHLKEEKKFYYDSKDLLFEILEILKWKPTVDEIGVAFCIARNKWDECVNMGEIAVYQLIESLNSGNLDAAYALGRIGDIRAVEPILKIIDRKESFLEIRCGKTEGKFTIFWRAKKAYDYDWDLFYKLRDEIEDMKEKLEISLIKILQDITHEKFDKPIEWKQWWNYNKNRF